MLERATSNGGTAPMRLSASSRRNEKYCQICDASFVPLHYKPREKWLAVSSSAGIWKEAAWGNECSERGRSLRRRIEEGLRTRISAIFLRWGEINGRRGAACHLS